MSNLSPQAQAIVDAYESTADKYKALAAVLHALTDEAENFYDPCEGKTAAVRVDDILKIVEELKH